MLVLSLAIGLVACGGSGAASSAAPAEQEAEKESEAPEPAAEEPAKEEAEPAAEEQEPAEEPAAEEAPAEETAEYDPASYEGKLAWYYPFPHPFGEACKEGVEAYVAETGVPINIVIGPEFTLTSELESLESMASQGYQYFMVFSVDAAACDGLYEEFEAQGRVCNNIGWGTTDETVAHHLVSTNIYESAYKAMEYVGEKLDYKGGIMLAYESPSDAAALERKAAVQDYLTEHPDMELVAEAFDVMTTAEASAKIENTMNANEGKIDAIVSLGFTCTQALVTTLGDYYERGGDKIICMGIDTDDLIFEGLRNDILDATVAQNSWGIGYISGEVLRLEADGWQPKEGKYHIDTGIVLVTKDNIDSYDKDLQDLTKEIVASLTTEYMEKP